VTELVTGFTCLRCSAATTNGLALCELCQRKAKADLEFLPAYFANLARWRPGRTGGSRVYRSRVLWDGAVRGSGDRVRDALDNASNSLTTWGRVLDEDRPGTLTVGDELDEAETARALCTAFDQHLTTISTLEWCGQFVIDVSAHEQTLRQLTEGSVPGWYAGACRRCAQPTYVVPGLTWVTCLGCGVTTYARDHLSTILGEARAWAARPGQIADALVALLDDESDSRRLHERIRKWAARGHLIAVDAWGYDPRLGYARDYDPVSAYRYRLGDVIDLLASMPTPRVNAVPAP
jgi:hypothetical protein